MLIVHSPTYVNIIKEIFHLKKNAGVILNSTWSVMGVCERERAYGRFSFCIILTAIQKKGKGEDLHYCPL